MSATGEGAGRPTVDQHRHQVVAAARPAVGEVDAAGGAVGEQREGVIAVALPQPHAVGPQAQDDLHVAPGRARRQRGAGRRSRPGWRSRPASDHSGGVSTTWSPRSHASARRPRRSRRPRRRDHGRGARRARDERHPRGGRHQRRDDPMVAAGDPDVAFTVGVRRAGGEGRISSMPSRAAMRSHSTAVSDSTTTLIHARTGRRPNRLTKVAKPVRGGAARCALGPGALGHGQLVDDGRHEVVPRREAGAAAPPRRSASRRRPVAVVVQATSDHDARQGRLLDQRQAELAEQRVRRARLPELLHAAFGHGAVGEASPWSPSAQVVTRFEHRDPQAAPVQRVGGDEPRQAPSDDDHLISHRRTFAGVVGCL